MVWTYDNLGEVTETQVYNGDNITPSTSGGTLSFSSDPSSALQAETMTSYDNQGQVYQTQQYSVDPTTGDVSSSALTTNYYYDPNGNQIAESAPGGLWTKDVYDGAGREVMKYQTDGGSGTSYSDASTVSGDIVLTQTQTVYDGDGNVIETITRDRFNTDSDSSTGALGCPDYGIGARVYYSANYYDLADRLVASVDVGTNGGSSWTRPTDLVDVPTDSLVTTYSYAADAVQDLSLTGSPTGGTFTLTFGGDTTSAIAYNASNSAVQSNLEALGSIGSGNVVVATLEGGGWEIRFTGTMAGAFQSQMTANSSGLTGGSSPAVAVSTLSLGGDNGNVVDTVDPDGIDTRAYYDPLGRVVQTVQDFTIGAVSDSSNKTTDYTYNSVGMTTLTAELLNGAGETTEWVYGVTTGTGSEIDSNDIVSTTEQPNPSTGAPDSSLETTVTVDGLGETLTSTDPNGTTHTYSYNVLGQQTLDDVTTLGTGVDGSVRSIATAYTTLGEPYLVTSYDDSDDVVNQVEDVYNGLGQLTDEYQAVTGAVNLSTTPAVEYNYTDLADGNNNRLTSIVYPDGYTVDYNYSSGLNSDISRLSSLSDDTGTMESYQFLGLDTIVEMDHPETDINLTYIGSGTGAAGDQYTGLDQFGRVVEQNWYDTSTDTSVVDLKYGYDNDSNVVWMMDGVHSASGALYNYDNLGQLTGYMTGDVISSGGGIGISGTVYESETWTYDPLGNHLEDSTTTSGTTTVDSTFNADNQITSMSGYTTPAYDAAGNMTTDQNGLQYIYDAWGRLVTVKNASDDTLETYSYDGFGDRVTNTVYSDGTSTTTNFYYSTAGQVLEEQAASSNYFTQRYVWSPAYVNEMVDRDTDTSGTGLTATGSSITRLWSINDTNYNVVALVNSSGSVVERYSYDPFGSVTVMTGSYGARIESSFGWVYLFQGMRLDIVTGNNLSRTRSENPGTGMWTSEDLMGFAAGNNNRNPSAR